MYYQDENYRISIISYFMNKVEIYQNKVQNKEALINRVLFKVGSPSYYANPTPGKTEYSKVGARLDP